MYAAVVRWAHMWRIRIYADGKYLVDFHVLIAEGKCCDMQLVAIELSQQRVKLRDPNMKLVLCNSLIMVVQ
jgi:hypothetical protein